MNEADSESFIKTQLEFFGHSAEDIYFGYPEQYHEERREAQAATEAEVAEVNARRERILGGAAIESRADRYVATDEEYALTLAYAKRHHMEDVSHKWYERRFRGRYASNVDFSEFPSVEPFVSTLSKWEWEYDPEKYPLPDPLPDAREFSKYFNEAIRLNEWSSAHFEACEWYKALPEDSPERTIAANYLAFAGNIVLHEYCRIAVALAHNELADDDFLSVKHLLTVCWPMAMRLEPFIPDEVKRAKQLLRETFLQMAARGNSSFRGHVELFGWAVLGQDRNAGLGKRGELENQAYKILLAFEDNEREDKEAIQQALLERAEKLASQQRWEVATDILELSTHAYGLPLADVQPAIDQYVLDAALHYTRDMSKMDEPWSYMVGKHEVWTSNSEMMSMLPLCHGISGEMYNKISEIEDIRGLEYDTHNLEDTSEEYKNEIVIKLFYKLADSAPDIAVRFADPELVERFMELLMHESTGKMSDLSTDNLVESLVKLTDKGVFTVEQQNSALLSIAEHVLVRATDPDDYDSFGRFIGFISPLFRMTKATEKPEDEAIWKFITPKQFANFMDNLFESAVTRDQANADWYSQQKKAFLRDIRKAWSDYWDVREEY